MGTDLIIVEKSNDIGKIIFNNGSLNILNIPMMEQINGALDRFLEDKSLKALVIGHEGKVFSAGVDVGDHMGDKAPVMLKEFHSIFKKLNRLMCPTIAAVKGAALGGGCEVALFCDIVLASEKAKFGQPEIKVGVFPPLAVLIFPYLAGHKKAYELLLQGETISAVEARELGLANHVFSLETYEQDITQFIERFEKLSTVVIQHTKKAIHLALGTDFDSQIDRLEEYYLKELMATHDANEGLQAFVDKRPPVWQNR
ncbi:MAG: enoyl-CoA hydratase/isomerase family protein [Candidatus Odinarchaeota archaeon]